MHNIQNIQSQFSSQFVKLSRFYCAFILCFKDLKDKLHSSSHEMHRSSSALEWSFLDWLWCGFSVFLTLHHSFAFPVTCRPLRKCLFKVSRFHRRSDKCNPLLIFWHIFSWGVADAATGGNMCGPTNMQYVILLFALDCLKPKEKSYQTADSSFSWHFSKPQMLLN